MIEYKVGQAKRDDLKRFNKVIIRRDKEKKEVEFLLKSKDKTKTLTKFIGLNIRKAEYEKVILNYFGITKKVD